MKKKRRLLVIGLSALVVIASIVWINIKKVQCVPASYGQYEQKYKFKGIFLFDEAIAFKGHIEDDKILHKTGDKVPRNEILADGIKSPEAGIVVNGLDGKENKFVRKNLDYITVKDIDEVLNNDKTMEGIKILDNSNWEICAYIDEDEEPFSKGDSCYVTIGENEYTGSVIEVITNYSGRYMLVKIDEDPEASDLRRGVTGYIIKSKREGIIVPASSICEGKDGAGVYVRINGYARYRKVKVLFKDSKNAVIKPDSTSKVISMYDDVIINPGAVKNGMRVR